jgi:hypothetical protein
MIDIEEPSVRQTVLAIPTLVDIRAFDAIPPLFADQVMLDYTSLFGGAPQNLSGHDVVAGWRALVPGFDATWHQLGPVDVKLLEGGGASARCSVDARHWLDGALWRPIGQYAFALEKTERWRVTAMRLEMENELGDRSLVEAAQRRARARTEN